MTVYVRCPRCRGSCQVFAYTRCPNDFSPGVGEYFTCPLCCGTGETDEAAAADFARQQKGEDE